MLWCDRSISQLRGSSLAHDLGGSWEKASPKGSTFPLPCSATSDGFMLCREEAQTAPGPSRNPPQISALSSQRWGEGRSVGEGQQAGILERDGALPGNLEPTSEAEVICIRKSLRNILGDSYSLAAPLLFILPTRKLKTVPTRLCWVLGSASLRGGGGR